MASYAIFNYQFGKIMNQSDEGELFPEEVSGADENFVMRQEIFNNILMDDFSKSKPIRYCNKQNHEKEYIHRFIVSPTDDIFIMRFANRRSTVIVNEDLKEKHEDDYQNCIVIIDNRKGIQRILVEQKKSAFQSPKQVENILQYTFNIMLHRYHLRIELMHLQDPETFWQRVNDRSSYPDGFFKLTLHLPHLNLERLRKVFDKVLIMSREVFDSDLEWSYKAQQGGELKLDEKNKYQKELIDWMMSEVGSENIKLFSNAQKRKAIVVGEDSFLAVGISDTTIRRLTEDSINGDLFGSSALNEIKTKTTTGIDLNVLKDDKAAK